MPRISTLPALHLPVLVGMHPILKRFLTEMESGLPLILFSMVGTLMVAMVSWFTRERPILRLQKKSRYGRKSGRNLAAETRCRSESAGSFWQPHACSSPAILSSASGDSPR
jgi:peptidoglycan/LPS O-acetylase OafA/YrhL